MTMIDAVERPDTTEAETILGVDTHLDFHVAVAVDHLGRRLGELSVPTTVKGYERLLRWAQRFGPVMCAGVEGTSSYGAGLARHLGAKGIEVLEVERPERRRRSSRRNLRVRPFGADRRHVPSSFRCSGHFPPEERERTDDTVRGHATGELL